MDETITESTLPRPSKGAGYWVRRIGIGIAGAIGTAIVIFAPNIGALSGVPVALTLALLSLVGTREFFRAVHNTEKAQPTEWIAYVACIVFQVFPLIYQAFPLIKSATFDHYREGVIALLVIATLLAELVKPRRTPLENIGTTLIGALYIGWLLSFLTLIRVSDYPFHVPVIHTPAGPWTTQTGAWMMIYVVGITMAGDTGARFAGNFFGRRKLAPLISPSKTMEGAIGGIACAIIAALGLGKWIGVPMVHAVVLGLLIGGIGLLGDLCESAMKRELGIKDFGTFFGNHGGVLDRCDSLLFTGPVAYYYMLLLLHR